MADHFKYYPSDEEVVTPWNARYSFPSQANKAQKSIPRIPPKNGALFYPGNIIRMEFPAQGYVDPLKTTLEFDVVLIGPTNSAQYVIRFQNNISSIINRMRLIYGANPSEDMQQYNVLVRALTEWTATNQMGSVDQTSITDGVGGYTWGSPADFTYSAGPPVLYTPAASTVGSGMVNTRQAFIQGINSYGITGTSGTAVGPSTGAVPNNSIVNTLPGGSATPTTLFCVRRYQISFALGMFTQDKLIPTKYMASQLVIEITLENAYACIYQPIGFSTNTTNPTYFVGNVNLIPEIIEFDDSYDAAFLKGLETGGVPIKFSTWDYFQFTTQGASSLQCQINERARSVKGMFVVQRRKPEVFTTDSHALLADSNTATSLLTAGSTMQTYQTRIGGRFFPGDKVQMCFNYGGAITNGGCEAFIELVKFLNTIGDYRLKPNVSVQNWLVPPTLAGILPEFDYTPTVFAYNQWGLPYAANVEIAGTGGGHSGTQPSSMYACAVSFETSNGIEISGLNAEEQSDIAFNVQWSQPQTVGFVIEAFVYVDRMWILRPNNYIDLIQ